MGEPHDGCFCVSQPGLVCGTLSSRHISYPTRTLRPACLRTYDVEADEHPCQLVTKYISSEEELFMGLGDSLQDWLDDARGMELPEVFRLSFRERH